MRLTILGCQSPYPSPGGATAGYLLQTETTNLLIDCGSGVISQLTHYLPIHQLDALFLSHYHHDHSADVGVLQYGLMVHQNIGDRSKDRPLPIYGPMEPTEKVQTLDYKGATTHISVKEQDIVKIGDLTVSFLRTDHPVLTYAMKFTHRGTSIVYGADSGIRTEWLPFALDTDIFICEGTYLEKNKPTTDTAGHLSVTQAAEVAEQIRAKIFIVTHLFPTYTEEEVGREASAYRRGAFFVAKVGLQIEV